MTILIITAIALALSTVAGTGIGLLIRHVPHRFNDTVLGAASGIMLAAAILGLILPASHAGPPATALPLTAAGVLLGALLVSLLDRIVPHLHRLAGLDQETHRNNRGTDKILLFVAAIALHKIPEGVAAGVSFGTGNTADILTVTGSLVLQNIPEAMVIAAPLLSIGVPARRTLGISCAIGIISMAAMIAGRGLIALGSGLMPLLLAFAGGTMLYVISDEMIPETHSHGYEKLVTFALLGGFLTVLILQRLLETL